MIKVYRQAGSIHRLGNTVASRYPWGNGLKGDGVNDLLVWPAGSCPINDNTDAFSIELWYMTGNIIPIPFWDLLYLNDRTIFAGSRMIGIRITNGGLSTVLPIDRRILYPYSFDPNTLYHVVWTKAASGLPVDDDFNTYLNKSLLTKVVQAGAYQTFNVSGQAMSVGFPGFRPGIHGSYYLLRVFNKALSSSEVADLYNFKMPNTAVSNIVQEIDFNQNRGNTAIATVGSSATLTGFSNTTDYGGVAWRNPKGGIAI